MTSVPLSGKGEPVVNGTKAAGTERRERASLMCCRHD